MEALREMLVTPPLQARVMVTTQSTDAVVIVRQRGIDAVICDIHAQPLPGPDVAALLSAGDARAPVILLGDRDEAVALMAGILSPAAGVFFKDSAVDQFVAGVQRVLQGGFAVARELIEPVLAPLSPAERQVLLRSAHGQSARSMADALGLTVEGARGNLAAVYEKLGLHDRADAVTWVSKVGDDALQDAAGTSAQR